MAVKRHGPRLQLNSVALVMAAVMAVSSLSGCTDVGDDEQEYYPHCVDPATGEVVDISRCDDNDNGSSNMLLYYILMSPQRYNTGQVVPASARNGSGWFLASDQTARANAGLPKSGSITGTTVRSSTGGFNGAHTGTGTVGS